MSQCLFALISINSTHTFGWAPRQRFHGWLPRLYTQRSSRLNADRLRAQQKWGVGIPKWVAMNNCCHNNGGHASVDVDVDVVVFVDLSLALSLTLSTHSTATEMCALFCDLNERVSKSCKRRRHPPSRSVLPRDL